MRTRELHAAFAGSEFGHELEGRTRFGDFQPDFVSNDDWCKLLGDDVNNLRHMPHTLGITHLFINQLGLRHEAAHDLKVTAITHDWGEAVIGDIAKPDKTDEHEKTERVAYKHIAERILRPTLAVELVDTTFPVLDPSTELGDKFRCIEYLGYYSTALRAKSVSDRVAHGITPVPYNRAQKEQLVGGLYALHRAVDIANAGTLAEYVKTHPKVAEVACRLR